MRILPVEDEAAIVLPLKKQLERQNWLVTAVPTVAGAREAIERETFDAALLVSLRMLRRFSILEGLARRE